MATTEQQPQDNRGPLADLAPLADSLSKGIAAVAIALYRLSRRKQLVEEYFGTAESASEWNPRYNIAPTQPVAVIRQNPKERRTPQRFHRRRPRFSCEEAGHAMHSYPNF